MRSIEEIVQMNNDEQAKQKEQRQFSDSFSSSNDSGNTLMRNALETIEGNLSDLSKTQQDQFLGAMMGIIDKMNRGIRLTNLDELPTPETNIKVDLQGINNVEAKVVNVTGLPEALSELKDSIATIVSGLKELEIRVPEIASPKITIPKPEVTVNVPPIKMPSFPEVRLPTINVPKAEVTITREEEPRIIEYLPQYNARNQLVSITLRYEDGTTSYATGFDSGKVTVRYA